MLALLLGAAAACNAEAADDRVAAEAEARAEAQQADDAVAEAEGAAAKKQAIEDDQQVEAYLQAFCDDVDAHIAAVEVAKTHPDPVERAVLLGQLYTEGTALNLRTFSDVVEAAYIGDERMRELRACQDELIDLDYG